MENRQDWFSVNNRILLEPPEFHATRHEQFRRDREKHEAKKAANTNQTVLACGCATVIEPFNHYRTVTVHFCPTHWKERKRN